MASITLNNLQGVFPDTTVVGAYLRSQWLPDAFQGAPTGAAVATGTVSSGSVTFTGLTVGQRYVAYAQVGGVATYRRFTTDNAGHVRTIAEGFATLGASLAASSRLIGFNQTATAGTGQSAGNAPNVFPIVGSMLAADKPLRLLAGLGTNAVAPGTGITFTYQLVPVTYGGTTNSLWTAGTAVTGSTITFAADVPAGLTPYTGGGLGTADFAAPATDGTYGVLLTWAGGTTAASSALAVGFRLVVLND